MGRIDPRLFEAIKQKSGLSRSRIYSLIEKKGREILIGRDAAAIHVAKDLGVNLSKYVDGEKLENARQGSPRTTSANPSPIVVKIPNEKRGKVARKSEYSTNRRRGNSVFVVHGRNSKIRAAMFTFLRSIGLTPLEWNSLLGQTGKASPYIGEVLDTAFRKAVAVVVLLTPDDEARLKEEFHSDDEPTYETKLTGQARPNVLFEAGMAFGKNPESTILVQFGKMRPFSDVAGRHVVNMTNATQKRQELLTKLANAGCNVDSSGTDWHTAGEFEI